MIEVGLGGRLDSTNVITPLVSVITHIALDHQKYLGDTVEEIAREKAAIAKPGVPLIIGESDPVLAEVIRVAADSATSEVVPSDAEWSGPLGLVGAHQRRNAAVALAALAALPDALRPSEAATSAAFAYARIAGRFDRRGKWIFDVAHNPDSMRALVGALGEVAPLRPVHALVSILGMTRSGPRCWSSYRPGNRCRCAHDCTERRYAEMGSRLAGALAGGSGEADRASAVAIDPGL